MRGASRPLGARDGSRFRRSGWTLIAGESFVPSVNEDTEVIFGIKRTVYRARFDRSMVVHAFDHRRLDARMVRKAVHGGVRNPALYLGLCEQRVRAAG